MALRSIRRLGYPGCLSNRRLRVLAAGSDCGPVQGLERYWSCSCWPSSSICLSMRSFLCARHPSSSLSRDWLASCAAENRPNQDKKCALNCVPVAALPQCPKSTPSLIRDISHCYT